MKQLIILSTFSIIILSCSIKKIPVFINVENIQFLKSTSKQITFTANANFMNPNIIGGELKTDGIKIFVNDNKIGTVSTESFKVPAKKKFSIPLKANIPIDSIFSNKNIGDLIGSLFSNTIKVQYKGKIKFKALGSFHDYYIDKTEEVKIEF